MSARVSIDSDNNLTINLMDLVEQMDDSTKVDLARALAFNKELFAGVLSSVTDGAYPEVWDGWSWDPESHEQFREQLIPLMPKVAQDCVRYLVGRLTQAEGEYERFRDYAWALDRWISNRSLYEKPSPIPTHVTHSAYERTSAAVEVLERALSSIGGDK